MSRQKDRDEFVALMTRENVPLDAARAMMRAATTLQRLAEAECNGDDWRDTRGPRHYPKNAPGRTACGEEVKALPPHTGHRTGVTRSSSHWARVSCSSCKAARIEERMAELARAHGLEAVFQGDPRGAVFKVKVPSGRTNDWGQTGVCVP